MSKEEIVSLAAQRNQERVLTQRITRLDFDLLTFDSPTFLEDLTRYHPSCEVCYNPGLANETQVPYVDLSRTKDGRRIKFEDQKQAMCRLHNQALEMGKPTYLEIGPGDLSSPATAVVCRPDSLVFAIDYCGLNGLPDEERIERYFPELYLPSSKPINVAFYFWEGIKGVPPHLKFDEVAIIAPNPGFVGDMFIIQRPEYVAEGFKRVKQGGTMTIVLDPDYGSTTSRIIKEIFSKKFPLSSYLGVKQLMSPDELRQEKGILVEESRYLKGFTQIPVLTITKF
ncbi:hypothetical protein ACFLZ1_05365 [Patescibacteria group bacterium]